MKLKVCKTYTREFSPSDLGCNQEEINSIIFKYCPNAEFDNEFPEYATSIEVYKPDWFDMLISINRNKLSNELQYLEDFKSAFKESDQNNDFINLFWI
jgi:hypothetical protein